MVEEREAATAVGARVVAKEAEERAAGTVGAERAADWAAAVMEVATEEAEMVAAMVAEVKGVD